ncbi:hypothetical protein Y032_0142g2291 [Ancylostoma ceylanicum]|nr:hypothetical protein Y032_0142g2291 [Ancylostoma ceylanicum]
MVFDLQRPVVPKQLVSTERCNHLRLTLPIQSSQSNGPKIVHNNENWNFKKENFAIAHSPTESTQATGGYKVVNLLRNLIPKSLPTELSSFFKRVLEKKTFNHEDHYNTPGISSIIQNVRSNDSSHAIGTMSNNWTPWYFTREDE